MLITPERLTYMIAVAETGSFSAAGRKFGVTASAVAQVIQNMEIDLDIVLFDRVAGKAPKLTEVGKALYLQALEVAPRLQAMEKRAQAYQAGVEDKLTIAVFGFTLFPEYVESINALSREFPELKINLIDVEETQGLAPNHDDAADIIIAPARLEVRTGYDAHIFDQIDWRFVVSPTHLLANKKGELSRHDLLDHTQIIPSENAFADKTLIESIRQSPSLIHCSRFYQLRALLLQGVGFSLLPAQLSEPLVSTNQLVELKLDFDDKNTRWPIEIAWSPSLGPAGRWFVEQFVEI
ncbi:LysR family transcriptional regulator [Vibrio europaeus]|uniref:LysR family transcriptional regulator n=1 Tax=Vibrio europaeus TaxID=300876 RepID=UPI00148C1ECB|nr:LysR family transcriptional regulator [Vibrio europaeus]MDC5822610.1 LysR family transcriptional regulator [Vibrio europaeus]MDC5838229.1 LysR family transcriptional regulator [Vibrio europaeus]MDC5854237.1 LysR family transcriptional regulator [Vibrio europaeus]MDC5869243.1 LysR family transcriptional regulator [Vibrio europaeus]NOH23503.1 LysR family transcriptional regulator [Vibrio europaeus]